jgi:hypothetical protein
MTVDPTPSLSMQGGSLIGGGSFTVDAGTTVSGNSTISVPVTNNEVVSQEIPSSRVPDKHFRRGIGPKLSVKTRRSA